MSNARLMLSVSLLVAACGGQRGEVIVREAAHHDVSAPLTSLVASPVTGERDCAGCGLSPGDDDGVAREPGPRVFVQARSIEQTRQGTRPAAVLLESFDGHGFGTRGPHGEGAGNNPSDNSMAVGPNHIVETVNSRLSVYTKKGAVYDRSGTPLFGPIATNVLFNGFGGECERAPNGDAVVRYDQLADRWLYVMPLFRRAVTVPPGRTQAPYGMCYALSTSANPLGPYHRYYFERELFPDYPRPAIWLDGYYVPTSTGDNLLPDGRLPEKHACVVERERMLRGEAAREQCVIMSDVNFLNNADIDGQGLPPAGAPNIMMATGGAQLRGDFEDDGIYAWQMHVDWENPTNTKVTGPVKIDVAPYHYMCDGQLTRCVPQPGTDMRLDSQGDKIMQRLVYRNIDGRESIVAVHSVNTAAGKGGVRWYEFRLNAQRLPVLHQQGTYAPDTFYRWMASPGMDRVGNIAMGYSFGGTPHFAGQRFAARLANDSAGMLTLHETLLVEGEAAQTNTLRWQDYTQLTMDPDDDCTFWYVGDYLKRGARSYTTRIGAFRLPGCRHGTLSGSAYFDVNRNGLREPNEPGIAQWPVTVRGSVQQPARVLTDSAGMWRHTAPADSAYAVPRYDVTADAPSNGAWRASSSGTAYSASVTIPMSSASYAFTLRDRDDVTRIDFGFACAVPNTGGAGAAFWLSAEGREVLRRNHQPPAGRGGGRGGALPAWRGLLGNTRYLLNADGSRFVVTDSVFDSAYGALSIWLATPSGGRHQFSRNLAVTSLNVAYGTQSGMVTVHDPVVDDWASVNTVLTRISSLLSRDDTERALVMYDAVLVGLNSNTESVTPLTPAACPGLR